MRENESIIELVLCHRVVYHGTQDECASEDKE